MAAVVAEGDLREEAVGGRGLPRDVGRRVRRPGSPVLGLEPLADRVAEVLRPLLRDLGEVPHTLAVALGSAVAQLVRARQPVWGGHPYVEPVVEALKPERQRFLRGLVIPRPRRLPVGVAEGIRFIPVIRLDFPVLDGPVGQQPAAGQGQRLAGQLPPVGEVLLGDGPLEFAAGDPAILHDARL